MIPIFRFPEFKKIKFINYFKLEKQDEPLFLQLTASRNKVHQLCTRNPQPIGIDNMLQAIDEYLPHLMSMVNWEKTAVERVEKAETRKETKDAKKDVPDIIEYLWRSGSSHKSTYFSMDDAQFELLMILASRAQLLFNRGALESPRLFLAGSETQSEDAGKTAKMYREAAGIWDIIGNELIPVLTDKISNMPPEMNMTFCQAMSTVSLAAAQFVIFLSATHRVKDGETGELKMPLTNPTVAARVGMDVVTKLETAKFLIESCKDVKKHVGDDIINYVHTIPDIMKAQVHSTSAEGKWATGKYGEAVGSIRAASNIITSISMPKKCGAELIEYVTRLRTKIEADLKKYQHENSFIYKQPVPADAHVALPEPSAIAKPIPYTMPEPLWTTLNSKRTKA